MIAIGNNANAEVMERIKARTTNDYGKALQFAQTEDCTSPNGPYPQYCATVLK